jgi:predicted GIY-YIG superfamily endonuclease
MIIPFRDLSELQRLPYPERRHLPEVSAVYFLIGADEVISKQAENVLYIGETKNLRNRWSSHSMIRLAKHRRTSCDWVIAWIEAAPDERQMIELVCSLKWEPPYSRDMYALPSFNAQEQARYSNAGEG